MDKYFSSAYDPRLDLAPVPATGLVDDSGWDRMLAVVQERADDRRVLDRRAKEERRRERERVRDEREARRRRKARAGSAGSDEEDACRARKEREEGQRKEDEAREASLMRMAYAKRGEERLWDQAKDQTRFT